MDKLLQAREFEVELDDTDEIGQQEELDNGEQNLENEAEAMLKSWNRNDLLNEIKEEKEKLNQDIESKTSDYYDGESDFDQIIKEMTPLDNGKVFIKVLEANPSGKQINATNTVVFDRIGFLEYELTPFESSAQDGKPCKISLIEGPIIPGMLQALIALREGERANIIIDPSMAFGKMGCFPIVPEDARLFYHVKIYRVFEESQLNNILSCEQTLLGRENFVPIEDKIALIEEHKIIANKFLADDLPRDAIIRYKAAIKCLDEIPVNELLKCETASKLMVVLLLNAAIAFNKLGMYKAATKMTKRALFFSPSNIKAYYQLAKARLGLCDYSGAMRWIEKADKVSPHNKCFDQLKLQLNSQFVEEKKKRDDLMRKMSSAYK